MAPKNKQIIFFIDRCLGSKEVEIFLKSIPKMQRFVRQNPAPFIAKIYRDGKVAMWKNAATLLSEIN